MAKIKQNHSYLNYNIMLLKIILIWPVERKILRTPQKIAQYITAFILLAISIGQLMTIMKTNDLRLISSTVDIFTLTASALYKQLFLAWNIDSMRHIVSFIHNDFHEMPLVENKGSKRKLFRMLHHLRYAKVCSKYHFLSAIMLALIWCFGPLLMPHAATGLVDSEINMTLGITSNEGSRRANLFQLNQTVDGSSYRPGNYDLQERLEKEDTTEYDVAGHPLFVNNRNNMERMENAREIQNPRRSPYRGKNYGNQNRHDEIAELSNDVELVDPSILYGTSHNKSNPNMDPDRKSGSLPQLRKPKPKGRNHSEPAYEGKYTSLKQRVILPMNVWTGKFCYINSPWYEIMLGVQFWAMLASCCIYLAIDTFYFSIIYICAGQLQLIHSSLQNMFPEEEELEMKTQVEKENDPRKQSHEINQFGEKVQSEVWKNRHMMRLVNESDHVRLCQIAELHAHVLRLVRFVEQTFTSTIIVDFFHAITSLSFALFHFQSAVGLVEFTKMYVFLIICILHQFLNNYFGEIIKYWQTQLSYSAYETPWYLRDKKFKRTILMITARTRMPILLNGLKMYVLCLASFIEFMKRAFSYYTVLREISI